ncbi:response regulator [Belliella marina]|uniref:Response regulator n=1 Tax=Belliella marina TaxID=1644146 RepID=A0ABW4VQY3_9BACT
MPNNVLIIEDEILIAKDLCYLIDEMGFNCIGTASTGKKALELFHFHQNIGLILCDIHLSGELDGVSLMEQIKSIREVPFIYISAYSDEKTVNRAIETVPSAFLTKPYNEKTLKIAINLAISNFEKKGFNLEKNPTYNKLTNREKEIILMIADGKTSSEIADKLFISTKTAAKHRNNILAKTGCKNTSELIKILFSD